MGRDTRNQFIVMAHGKEFDVDAFLATTPLTFDQVWRRGEQRDACIESHYETSGVRMNLGDGKAIPIPQQEALAFQFLVDNRDALRELASRPGADHRILGLHYHIELDTSIGGFAMGPTSRLMAALLEVGFRPTYYVTIDHVERRSRSSFPVPPRPRNSQG
jgi:hypothetical protein